MYPVFPRSKKPAHRLVLISLLSLACFSVSKAAFAGSLNLGPFDQGVFTGTPPFSVTANCLDPGDDCSDEDERVRSNDLVSFTWSIVANGFSPLDPQFHAVVFEQTLVPQDGASLRIEELPLTCQAPPMGTGGANPQSSITEHSDGSISLLCNIGSMGNGSQVSFAVPVRPLGGSPNGSFFTTTQKVYALDSEGARVTPDFEYVNSTNYHVSAAPAWDLIGDRVDLHEAGVATEDLGTGRGEEEGLVIWTTAHLAVDADRLGKGVSSLQSMFDFDSKLYAKASDGFTDIPIEYKIVGCEPNNIDSGLAVWGSEQVQPHRPLEEHVVSSGDCTVSGSVQDGWTLTANNVDTSGSRFPLQTINGTSLAGGPYFQMAYKLQLFLPFSQIEKENPEPDSGKLHLTHCLTEFDPFDLAGISNYAEQHEPGHNGIAMPDGSASNNCSGPLPVQIGSGGVYYFRVADSVNDQGDIVESSVLSGLHTGLGLAEPDVSWAYLNVLANSGGAPMSGVNLCTRFDNSTHQLSTREQVGGSPGSHAWVAASLGANAEDWTIEYAAAPVSGDDPLDGDHDGVADFNPKTGRFHGDWSELKTLDCSDPSLQWYQNPNDPGTGEINLVRVVPKLSGTTLDNNQQINLIVPVTARTDFYKGLYQGTPMPAGVVMPGFGTKRYIENGNQWREIEYQPAPESGHWDGDRVTFTRVRVDVAKSTVAPIASYGESVPVLAGNDVVWQLDPAISSVRAQGGIAENLVVTDTLPEDIFYDAEELKSE